MSSMTLFGCSPSLLKFPERNFRRHSTKQVAKLVKIIGEVGFNSPVIVDESNEILAGVLRALAAIDLGKSEIPVVQLKGLSEAQKRAYRLADNRIAEDSDWDVDALKIEFPELESLRLDLSLTGFDTPEIDAFFFGRTGQ